jgi:hypothetical protein
VTNPNAGGSFAQQSNLSVEWNLAAPADNGWLVAYAVAADNTHHWLSTLDAVAAQTAYSYSWDITQPAGAGYKIRVWYVDGSGNWLFYDDSDAPFEITAAP